MKTVPLILALMTAAPAFAGDFPIFLGHRDPEYRGRVNRWPEVCRAREIERLCLPQQLAIYERDRMALDAVTPSLYRPRYEPAAAVAPAAAPPAPTVPSASRPAAPSDRVGSADGRGTAVGGPPR